MAMRLLMLIASDTPLRIGGISSAVLLQAMEQSSNEITAAEADESPTPKGDGNLKCSVLFLRIACMYCG